ncbi:hypothetical protein Hamer_G021656 [Homarus americanus]|uniref:Uncharacterized protein n=1 Tax=Homarus americanus TaxID=6706 RepID=A0A8J5JQ53_HOMAM|nr:hypothetical protein Hamer_G021656 [Homarus americanus]
MMCTGDSCAYSSVRVTHVRILVYGSSVTGRGSGDKPPSGQSRSVSRGKENEPRGRPTTRERPEDEDVSLEDDLDESTSTRGEAKPEAEEGKDGCLNVSKLAGQVSLD